MLLPGLQACSLVYKPNRPVYGLVDQYEDYFSYTNICKDNYSIEYFYRSVHQQTGLSDGTPWQTGL